MFGMGTGVALPLWPPHSTYKADCGKIFCIVQRNFAFFKDLMEMKSCIVVLHTGFRLDLISKERMVS